MEGLIILILLGLVVFIIVMPIVALVSAGKANREGAETRRELARVSKALEQLQRSVAAARPAAESASPTPPGPAAPPPASEPVAAAPEFAPPVATPTMAAPVRPPPAAPPPVAPIEGLAELSAMPPPLPARAPAPSATPTAPTPPPQPPAATEDVAEPTPEPVAAFNLEQFMGVKLFAWLGGIALFLGAAFFLKLSFESGWVPPPVRAAMGFVLGAGLLVGGLFSVRRNYAAAGQSLCATGVLVLYGVTFACRAYYEFPLFTRPHIALPFGLMVLTTTVAFLLAVRLRAQVVAILGLAGGFLTPVLLSTGEDNAVGLFGYVALLDLGLLAVALRCRWQYLAVLAAAGTAALQAGWADKFFVVEKLTTAVAICVLFVALFTAAVAAARRLGRASDWLAGAAFVPMIVAVGFVLGFTNMPDVARQPGWVLGLLLVADLAALAVAVLHPSMCRAHLAAGLAALLVTAIWITEAAATELLPWALGFVFLFAALHTVFPFVLRRFNPEVRETRWSGLFAPLGLLVLIVPIVILEDTGWLLWPVVLLLNLVAIAAAAASGLLVAVAGALVLTLIGLGVAITRLPTASAGGGLELALIAGFAAIFVAASVWLVRRFAQRETDDDAPAEPPWLLHLPAASAAMPFVLLVMLAVRLPMSNPSSVFGVALLLVALLCGLGTVARQGALVLAGFVGTLILEYAWAAEHLRTADVGAATTWTVGFALLFTVFPFLVRNALLPLQLPWAVAALSLPLHFLLLTRCVRLGWPAAYDSAAGALAAVCALPALAGLVVLLRTVPADAPWRLNRLAWFGGSALFFITLIFPLHFSEQPQYLTLSWALEGAALLWLFHRVPHPGLRVVGVALLVATFARLVLNPAIFDYAARGEWPIFNWILVVYGVAALCCFAGARLLAPPRDRVLGISAPPTLAALGTILAFALVNLEIADYFTSAGSRLRPDFSGHFARDMSYTIAWSVFAFVLMVIGLVRRLPAPRYAGMALLLVACGKLIIHDLARLAQGYRIGAIMVVAIILLTAAFAYQRFFRGAQKGN